MILAYIVDDTSQTIADRASSYRLSDPLNNQEQTVTHYNDVIVNTMVSQITSLTIVYSAIYSGTDQRKHQSSASLVFVRGIHRWPVNSPHKWGYAENVPIWWRLHAVAIGVYECCVIECVVYMCYKAKTVKFLKCSGPKLYEASSWH